MAGQACDLCGESNFAPLADRDRRGQPLETVVCCRCGLVSHARIPAAAELAAYYHQHYRQEYHNEYAPSPHRVVREWGRGRRLLKKLRPFIPAGGRVLEVGSGIGCTVMNFALAGYQSCGIEPGEGFAEFSRKVLGAPVRQTTLADLLPQADQDLVLLVHVLEHLPRPTVALQQIHALLRPGGQLYVEVPNFALPHAAPGKQFHYAHIYNFTPTTLTGLLTKTGFTLTRVCHQPGDKVIGLLLAKGETGEFVIDERGFGESVSAATRHTVWSYHLRPAYLRDRLRVGIAHLCDHFSAAWQMERIVARCQRYARRRAQLEPMAASLHMATQIP